MYIIGHKDLLKRIRKSYPFFQNKYIDIGIYKSDIPSDLVISQIFI